MTSDSGDTLAGALATVQKCPDSFWWHHILAKDPLYGKIPADARQEIIARSVDCAVRLYDRLTAGYGRLSAAEYADRLGVTVVAEDMKTEFEYIFISSYTANPPTITVSSAALDLLSGLIARENLPGLLTRDGLTELATAHELFHHLEYRTPGIITRQKTVEYRVLKFIKYRISPVAAGEIAAVHFSRLLTGLPYSPAVYEILLLSLQNSLRAKTALAALLASARDAAAGQ